MTKLDRSKKSVGGVWVAGNACAMVVLVALAHRAVADPLQIGVGYDERYSDNINLSANDPKSDFLDEPFLTLNQKTDPGVCGSDLNAQARYIHYQRNTYSDRTEINGSWLGNCDITNSLTWTASDHISEQTVNTNLPSTPNNQTRQNVFSTGPQYLWRISNRDQLLTSAQAQRTTFSGQSQSNAKHYIGNADYTHQVSPGLSIGTGGSINRGELDDGQTITVRSGNVNFQKSFITTKVTGKFGYSWLTDEYQGTTSHNKGVTWSLRLDRQLSGKSRWYAEYARELTDTSSAYVFQVAGLTFNLAQSTAVRVTHWTTGYTQTFSSGGSLNLSLGQQISDYLEQNYTEKTTSGSIQYSQPIVTNLSGTATVSAGHQSNDLTQLSYHTYGGSVGLNYQRTRQLSFRLQVGRQQRVAEANNDGYQENWAMVGAKYLFR